MGWLGQELGCHLQQASTVNELAVCWRPVAIGVAVCARVLPDALIWSGCCFSINTSETQAHTHSIMSELSSACKQSLAHALSKETGTSQLTKGACTDSFTPTQSLLSAAHTLPALKSATTVYRPQTPQLLASKHSSSHTLANILHSRHRSALQGSTLCLCLGTASRGVLSSQCTGLVGVGACTPGAPMRTARHSVTGALSRGTGPGCIGSHWQSLSLGVIGSHWQSLAGTSAAALAHARGIFSSQGASLVRAGACSRRGVVTPADVGCRTGWTRVPKDDRSGL